MIAKLFKGKSKLFKIVGFSFLGVVVLAVAYFSYSYYRKTQDEISKLNTSKANLNKVITQINSDLTDLKSQDQYKINKDLDTKIASIEATYKQTVTLYEKLLDLKTLTKKTDKFDSGFADVLSLLSKKNYASAEAELAGLTNDIDAETQKINDSFKVPANLPENNSPPGSGYQSQLVKSDVGDFMVEIIAADLNSTRVVVDTASDSDCSNNCPVLSLSDYVSRSGAYAGVNGSYFCPPEYPSCAGKTNSYDTLILNKNKKYINSANNVYSTVPAVIFSGNSARYVTQSLQWGRDTSPDAVIAMQPLLLLNGNIMFNGGGQPKEGNKGSRSFIGTTNSTVYIGVVFNATVAESAHVLHTLGIQNALNLDDGGSTALWNGGYKAGPGRNLPNAVLLIRK